jgi:hypothetical protein
MKDIFEVLRRKQAQQAQLGKEIELLQQAAEKLREVAPLLHDGDGDDNSVLGEMDETPESGMAARATAGSGSQPAARPGKASPRWP